MVGDGVNDAAALSAASVGIAVHGGAEASLAAAQVYLDRPGLMPIVELIHAARNTLRAIRRCLIASLCYNAICRRSGHGRPDQPAVGGDPDADQLVHGAGAELRGANLPRAAMSVIYVVLPLAAVMAAAGVAAFIWSVRRGQFDDLDTPAIRILP